MGSFSDLTKKENLERLDIDARLIPAFKRVMIKMQNLFDAFSYNDVKDYKSFFEKFLLTDNEKEKVGIYVNSLPEIMGGGCIAFYDKARKRICIDEKCFNSPHLEASIFHEFIHFIVLHDLDEKKTDRSIYDGGFINEALTHMFTLLAYPETKAYMPQVKLLEYSNFLTNKVNNYRVFLRGGIDSKQTSSAWSSFVEHADLYQEEYLSKGFKLETAKKDKNYIMAQRYLIYQNIHPHLIRTLDDYNQALLKIQKRVVDDDEFILNFIAELEQSFVNNIVIENKLKESDGLFRDFLLKQIKRYTTCFLKLYEYPEDVFEITLAGKKIAFDENGEVYGDTSGIIIKKNFSGLEKEMSFETDDKICTYNFMGINFKKRNERLKEEIKDLEQYFNTKNRDLKKIEELAMGDKRVWQLEKFLLPNVDLDLVRKPIYVIRYKDSVEICDEPWFKGTIKDADVYQFLGLVSLEQGAIWANKVGKIEQGFEYCFVNDKKMKNYYFKKETSNLKKDSEKIRKIIKEYQMSSEYEEDDMVEDSAISYYLEKKYKSLTDEEKNKLREEILKKSIHFIVYMDKGEIKVALKKGPMAFECKKVSLLDNEKSGLYDDVYDRLLLRNLEDEKEATRISSKK